MQITTMIECVVATDPRDIQGAFRLRHVVFVEEQNVPEDMELDEFDKDAVHVVSKDGDKIVGTGRMVIEGDRGRIGRMAVEKDVRGRGIGTKIMAQLEKEAHQRRLTEIYLHAQVHAKKFYEDLGYTPRGDVFDEAGIDHIEMYKENP